MKKVLLNTLGGVLALAMAMAGANAQVSKAASEATEAAQHKIDQKRAESEAKDSGPVGKVVNNAKAGYHKKQAERSAKKAKQAVKDAV